MGKVVPHSEWNIYKNKMGKLLTILSGISTRTRWARLFTLVLVDIPLRMLNSLTHLVPVDIPLRMLKNLTHLILVDIPLRMLSNLTHCSAFSMG
jgi:hypothetical protein